MKALIFVLAILFLSTATAQAVTLAPYVYLYDPSTGRTLVVKNCAAPNLLSLAPQAGIAAAQTCFCSWSDAGANGLILTCAMPTGTRVVQQADPRLYQLVAINRTQNAIQAIPPPPCKKGGANEDHASQNGIDNSSKNCK